jgi:hypothetical protein
MSWRSTLEADPFAAMGERRDIDGVVGSDYGQRDPSKCWAWVTRQAHTEACGLPVGPDGRCADGHEAVLAR